MRTASCLLLALLLVLALLAGCGGQEAETTGSGDAGSGSGGPVGRAEDSACAANRRVISSAAQQYMTMEGKPPSSLSSLVPGYLQSVPSCPAGGTYTLYGTRVVCSVHGE